MRSRLGKPPCCYTIHGAQAAQVLLDAIAASDGSRAAVTSRLFRGRVREGLIGSFGFDRNGDTTLRQIMIHRIHRGELKFVTAITPAAGLTAR
jgi:branched-chain amino acid transport system substrate-binding protein